MNNTIITVLPESIQKYTDLMANFIDGMIQKLDKNSHKDTPTLKTIPAIIDDLELEVDEFEEQFFTDKDSENTLIELFDIANFALLAYIALRQQGVEHEDNAGIAS